MVTLNLTFIGGGVVDTIPTPAKVLSQLSKQDLLRETHLDINYVDTSKFPLSAQFFPVIISY